MGPRRGWVVVPAYNEEEGLGRFVQDLAGTLSVLAATGRYEFTIHVVDDGSSDRTGAVIAELSKNSSAPVAVSGTTLIRNFGHQAALIAGLLQAARGNADFAVTMDADGEHPPGIVPLLVEAWERGNVIVHTARRDAAGLSTAKRLMSRNYYRLLRRISGLEIMPGMADFKLWDGALLRQIEDSLPTCGSTRALAAWLFPAGERIPYDQKVVPGRRSRYSARKMLSLAAEGIVQHSELPLRLAILTGMASLLFALALGSFAIWAVIAGRTVPGWASTMIAIAVFSAAQSISLGILGEYLLRNVFRRSRPRFIAGRHDLSP